MKYCIFTGDQIRNKALRNTCILFIHNGSILHYIVTNTLTIYTNYIHVQKRSFDLFWLAVIILKVVFKWITAERKMCWLKINKNTGIKHLDKHWLLKSFWRSLLETIKRQNHIWACVYSRYKKSLCFVVISCKSFFFKAFLVSFIIIFIPFWYDFSQISCRSQYSLNHQN